MNSKILTMILMLAGVMIPPVELSAHGDKPHAKAKTEQVQEKPAYEIPGMNDFPALHPMVVHFPIVLFLLVPFLWIFGIFRKNQEILILALGLQLLGLIAAILASNWMHPHTGELPAVAQETLERHDFWADATLYTALLTSFLIGVSIWFRRFAKVYSIGAMITAIITALCVSLTGHFGAALTHIHGVGPQGNHLQLNSGYKQDHKH